MGYEATPIEIAFGSPLKDPNSDAELRHRRRERIAATPNTNTNTNSHVADEPAQPVAKKRRKNVYENECTRPVTSGAETGPRCESSSPGGNGMFVSCPRCMHVLGMQSSAAALPYGEPETLHSRRLVDEFRADIPRKKSGGNGQKQPSSNGIPMQTVEVPEPVAQFIKTVFKFNIPSELMYAIAVLVVILLVAMADRRRM